MCRYEIVWSHYVRFMFTIVSMLKWIQVYFIHEFHRFVSLLYRHKKHFVTFRSKSDRHWILFAHLPQRALFLTANQVMKDDLLSHKNAYQRHFNCLWLLWLANTSLYVIENIHKAPSQSQPAQAFTHIFLKRMTKNQIKENTFQLTKTCDGSHWMASVFLFPFQFLFETITFNKRNNKMEN